MRKPIFTSITVLFGIMAIMLGADQGYVLAVASCGIAALAAGFAR